MYRKMKRWTQAELAKSARLSFRTILRIEKGYTTNPGTITLAKIAQALKVELQSLFMEEE